MNISKFLGILAIGAVLVVGACSPAGKAQSTAPKTALIKIEFGDDAMESWRPLSTVISAGGSVTWMNSGHNVHQVISGEGVFNKTLSPGESFTFIYTHSGNFSYHDDPNNYYTEPGAITVQ